MKENFVIAYNTKKKIKEKKREEKKRMRKKRGCRTLKCPTALSTQKRYL